MNINEYLACLDVVGDWVMLFFAAFLQLLLEPLLVSSGDMTLESLRESKLGLDLEIQVD